MEKFAFNHAVQQWDSWKEFYFLSGPFVEFADGSLGIYKKPEPHHRRYWERYGLEILIASEGKPWPKVYADKERTQLVARTTLANGYYVWDRKRKVIVAAINNGYAKGAINTLHNHRDRLYAYWPRADVDPVPIHPVVYSELDREAKAKFKPWLKEVRDTLRGQFAMMPELDTYRAFNASPTHISTLLHLEGRPTITAGQSAVDILLSRWPDPQDFIVALYPKLLEGKSYAYGQLSSSLVAHNLAYAGIETLRKVRTTPMLFV
jgi:hypothetical protein